VTFEKMLTYANHVGLFSEEVALTGEQIGNFPQAFTHLALIDAAITLDRRLDLGPPAAARRTPTVPVQRAAGSTTRPTAPSATATRTDASH
jgi:hypothetical protein